MKVLSGWEPIEEQVSSILATASTTEEQEKPCRIEVSDAFAQTPTEPFGLAAIDGQGVVLGRRLLMGDDLEAGRLVRLDATSLSLDRALYFVCRTEDLDKTKIRSLRDWLFSVRTPET